jgi:hypothetical protein
MMAWGGRWGLWVLAAWWAGAAAAQTVGTVPTFHNIGIELTFPSTPAATTAVELDVRVAGSGEFRPAHPLSRLDNRTFAGTVFWLDPGTSYELRLRSTALASNLVVTASTRADVFGGATWTNYHVNPVTGSDANTGLSAGQAYRTLGKALTKLGPGVRVSLHGGRYDEGDYEINAAGTEAAPIVIENAAGEWPVLSGLNTNFTPSWVSHDVANQLYRAPCTVVPYNAYLNGEQFFHFGNYVGLRDRADGQEVGYWADGTNLFARFPGGAAPGTNRVTIPRFTAALTLNATAHHVHLVGLEIAYYGLLAGSKGVYVNGADSNLIDRCHIHHVGPGVGIKREAWHNTIQNCRFSESPLSGWSWDAVKNNPGYAYEAGGVVVYNSPFTNAGNVIRYNTFSNMFDGSFLYSTDASGPTKSMDVHDNRYEYCGDDAIETDGYGSNVRIYGNRFREFLSGISVAPCRPGPTYILRNIMEGSPTYGPDARLPIKFNVGGNASSQWIYLYHNTMHTAVTDQDGFVMWAYSQWTNVVSRNNIFAGQRYAFYATAIPNPVDFDYDNLWDIGGGSFGRWAGVRYETFDAFKAASGQEANGWALNPGFTNVAAGDFRLVSGSPMIGRGVVLPGINDDWVGSGPDVGALEFGSEAAALALAGGTATVDWVTGERAAYQMQWAGGLGGTGWSNAGNVVTTRTYRARVSTPLGSATQGFFRLQRVGE